MAWILLSYYILRVNFFSFYNKTTFARVVASVACVLLTCDTRSVLALLAVQTTRTGSWTASVEWATWRASLFLPLMVAQVRPKTVFTLPNLAFHLLWHPLINATDSEDSVPESSRCLAVDNRTLYQRYRGVAASTIVLPLGRHLITIQASRTKCKIYTYNLTTNAG